MEALKKVMMKLNPTHGALSWGQYREISRKRPLEKGKVRLFGTEIFFSDCNGFIHSAREIFVDEVYKFTVSKTTPRIIDVGSNIGLSIIYFKNLYPRSRILAFEPDPHIFQILRQNMSAMGYEDVVLRNSAAWIDNTNLCFFSEGSLAGSTLAGFEQSRPSQSVKAERLRDTILEEEQIDLLKIDVEGSENDLIFDIADVLFKTDRMFIEYHSLEDTPQRLGDILNVVGGAGFRYSIQQATFEGRHPFVDRPARPFDLQLNIFCYR